MGRRSELSVSKRREVIIALLRREEPAAQLARRYGISEQTLYRWRDEFLAAGEAALAALAGKKNKHGDSQKQKLEDLERELAQRDQVIGELTIANRILKKIGESST
jgi:transposase-like protein